MAQHLAVEGHPTVPDAVTCELCCLLSLLSQCMRSLTAAV